MDGSQCGMCFSNPRAHGVVNRCMRNNQREELLYWQPFLYHLDQAMFALSRRWK